ncbi:glycosyltransferase family 2 protein [Chloroflexota bacterium]
MSTEYPKVILEVLSWNKWEYLLRLLESVYQISYPNFDVIVVDNASTDGSIQKIKEWAEGQIPVGGKFFNYDPSAKPSSCIEYTEVEAETGGRTEKENANLQTNKRLILIKNEGNYGTSRGRNVGLRYALNVLKPDYVMLLDNDIYVDTSFLDELVSVAIQRPDAGMLGPKIYEYENLTKLWSIGGRINYWTFSFFEHDRLAKAVEGQDIVTVDYLPLSCVLIPSRVLLTVGLLDEVFFWSSEGLDLSIRLAKYGFQLLAITKSKVWHDLVRPLGYKERIADIQTYVWWKNRLILYRKHWRGLQFASVIFFFLLIQVKSAFQFILFSRNLNHLKLYFKGLGEYLKWRRGWRP